MNRIIYTEIDEIKYKKGYIYIIWVREFGKNNEYIIKIGQNRRDNFDIIDAACSNDIWFHVEGMSSCHVILKTEQKMSGIPLQVIKRCAYLCKINSKAKTQSKCNISYIIIN